MSAEHTGISQRESLKIATLTRKGINMTILEPISKSDMACLSIQKPKTVTGWERRKKKQNRTEQLNGLISTST